MNWLTPLQRSPTRLRRREAGWEEHSEIMRGISSKKEDGPLSRRGHCRSRRIRFRSGNSFAVVRGENVVEERGFSGSEESREDGVWCAICGHHGLWFNARVRGLLPERPTLETDRETSPTSPRPSRVRGR